MARLSSAKKRRKQKSVKIGIALLVASLGTIALVTFFYQHLISTRIEVDTDTLCPIDGPNAVIALLIDSTDPFSGVQKEFLIKYFEELEKELEKGALVNLFSAASYSEDGFQPVASLCNPGNGSDISEWSGNPGKVRKKWIKSFMEPLSEALKSSIEASASATSPLLVMIKAVSYKSFPTTSSTMPKKLIIISDMLEHTENYSQYSSSLDFTKVSQLPFYAHITPNLYGVEVYVIYISRKGVEQLQTRRHAEFWSNYFKQVGASLQSIKRI